MRTYRDFFTDVLAGLGIPAYTHTLYALASVATLEGLNDRYNPLNSVVPYGDSTDFNSVHVQDYKSYENGVAGTIALLRGEPWTRVVHAMRSDEWSFKILHEFRTVYETWGANPHFPANHALLDRTIDGDHHSVTHTAEPPPAPVYDSDPHVYTVKRGDTLYGIAGEMLHNPGRWPEIAQLNKIHAPYIIYPDQRLAIPAE